MKNRDILNCLEKVLKNNGVPESEFGTKGLGEDRVCIEKIQDAWNVYYGYHGRRTDIDKFPNIEDACKNMIERFAENSEEEEKMTYDFESELEKLRNNT